MDRPRLMSIKNLKDKVMQLVDLNQYYADRADAARKKKDIPGKVNIKKETERLLRQVFLKNEVPGGKQEACYELGLARTPRSGVSFGLCQWDIVNNGLARKFLRELLDFYDPEYFPVLYKLRGGEPGNPNFSHLTVDEKEVVLKTNEILLRERNKVDKLDIDRLRYLIEHVVDRFQPVIDLNFSMVLHLADMSNQFGHFSYSGGTVDANTEWVSKSLEDRMRPLCWKLKTNESEEVLIKTWNKTREYCSKHHIDFNMNQWEIFFLWFKLRTKHGQNYHDDVSRRWLNIHKIVNENKNLFSEKIV